MTGHAPSWCTACLLGLWMVASPPTNASDIVDGPPLPTPLEVRAAAPARASPLWMPTAGVRSCHRGHHVSPAGHALPTLHRRTNSPLPVTRRTYTGSASIVSPPRTGWQPASCLHAASDARGSDTSRRIVSDGGWCLLSAPAHLVPWKTGHNDLSRSVPQAPSRVLRATHRAQLELCRVRLQLCQVRLRAVAMGADIRDVGDD
jgi:hypothetical protein